jgi:U3 small nucleolar RNA-associated protein 4
MTVVSGDSLGRVMFWDGRTGVMLQSLTTHDADVLAVVVDHSGTGVFASGIDHKVVHLQSVAVDAQTLAPGQEPVCFKKLLK